MFGFGKRNANRGYSRNVGFLGGGFRRAALVSLGMMAFRWWRNRGAAPQVTRRDPATQL